MEHLYNLLFELSNEDRFTILKTLEIESMNITTLSKKLDLTTQETSRHLSRLGKVRLTHKDTKGDHNITHYGTIILKQLDGLNFLTEHVEYFTSHSLTGLPQFFTSHIGDLENSTYIYDISLSFYNVERLITEAEEYVWAITDHYLMGQFSLYTDALTRGIKVKSIEPMDWVVPEKIKEGYSNEDSYSVNRARRTGTLEEKLQDKINIYLYLSEKTAIACFPLLTGRFDYLGFTSTDDRAHTWCKTLFQDQWEEAIDRKIIAQKLCEWIKDKPKMFQTLKKIEAKKDISNEEDSVSELEKMSLIKDGRLTISGDMLLRELKT